MRQRERESIARCETEREHLLGVRQREREREHLLGVRQRERAFARCEIESIC